MKILQNINLPYNASHDDAVKKALELLKLPPDTNAYVYRQSIDARRKSSIKQVFSVAFDDEISNDKLTNINEYKFNPKKINKTVRPLIVGCLLYTS